MEESGVDDSVSDWPFGPYALPSVKALSPVEFSALARATTWRKEEKEVTWELGVPRRLDPKHVRDVGEVVVKSFARLDPRQALALAMALSRPLFEGRASYGLGQDDRVTLEVLRRAVPRMLEDFGLAATRLMLACVADVPPSSLGDPLGLSPEDLAYAERVSRRCAVALHDESLHLPAFSSIPVPEVSMADEERDASTTVERIVPEPETEPSPAEPATPNPASDGPGEGIPFERQALEQLEAVRQELELALRTSTERVAQGEMPAPGLRQALSVLEEQVAGMADRIGSALVAVGGGGEVIRTPTGLAEAVRQLEGAIEQRRREAAIAEQDARHAEVIERVEYLAGRLPTPTSLPEKARVLLERHLELLRGAQDWGEPEERTATALEVLGDVHLAALGGDRLAVLEIILSRGPLVTDELKPLLVAVEGASAHSVDPPRSGAAASLESSSHEEQAPAPSVDPPVPRPGPDRAERTTSVAADSGSGIASEPRSRATRQGPSVDAWIARSVDEDAFGLAHEIAFAAGWTRPKLRVLSAAAHADNVRENLGGAAVAYDREAQQFSLDGLEQNRGLQLLALASAVRCSLVAPVGGATAVLTELEGVVDAPEAQEFIREVRHNQGLLSAVQDAEGADDRARIEAGVLAGSERAKTLLVEARERTGPFHRVSAVWRDWLHARGPLGSALEIVATDDRSRADEVVGRIRSFADPRDVAELMHSTDARLANGKREIEARALQWLLRATEEIVDALRNWAEPLRELEAATRRDAHREGPVGNFRAKVRNLRDPVLAWLDRELEMATTGEGHQFRVACIGAARRSIDLSMRLVVDGDRLMGREVPAEDVLYIDVARAIGIPFSAYVHDRQGALGERNHVNDPVDLAAALDITPIEAFDERLEAHEHRAARLLLDRMRRDGLGEDRLAPLARRRDERLAAARRDLGSLYDACEAAIQKARHQQHFFGDFGADAKIQGLRSKLDLLRPDDAVEDVAISRERLLGFQEEMLAVRRTGQEAARARLKSVLEKARRATSDVRRVEQLIDAGDLETAQDLMLRMSEGVDLPVEEDYTGAISAFWPTVPAGLAASGAGPDQVLDAIERRSAASAAVPVDYSGLSDAARERAAQGMRAWSRLQGAAEATSDPKPHLTDVLALVGLSDARMRVLRPTTAPGAPVGGRSWSRFIVTGAGTGGQVSLHQFGSKAEGRYQLLIASRRPSVDNLLQWVWQCPTDAPIIVLYMGLLEPKDRLELATAARGLRRIAGVNRETEDERLFVVVDLAVAAALAASEQSFNATLSLTVPFSWVDPYLPNVSVVPPELFYGRRDELTAVEDGFGTSVIYGGRQFGKSALLRAAQRRFELSRPGNTAIYIDLEVHGIGRTIPPEAAITAIAEELTRKQIPVSRKPGADEAADIRDRIHSWLGEGDRRLLILLDEADAFLNADAPEFSTVQAIKGLMDIDSSRRVKPVFAGVHQVQRFLALRNNPFAHLGRWLEIGTLQPGAAADLVQRPLATLGIRFESPDLVMRFLSKANYNPKWIQHLCHMLVRRMRARWPDDGVLPLSVTDEIIDEVFDDPEAMEFIQGQLGLTLGMDERYRVIAYAMAERSIAAESNAAMLLEEIHRICLQWWPDGFEGTSVGHLETLAREMVGLGVLVQEGGRSFALRSPDVLASLGGRKRIEEVLLEPRPLRPNPYDMSVFRSRVEGGSDRRSPFSDQVATEALRIDRVAAPVRVILGSRATSIDLALEAIKATVKLRHSREATRGRKKQAEAVRRLIGGEDRQRQYNLDVVEVDHVGTGPDGVLAAIEQLVDAVRVRAARSGEGGTGQVRVFITVGPDALRVWDRIVQEAQESSVLAVTNLARMEDAALRAWGRDINQYLETSEQLEAVKRATGGWPLLVDDLFRRSSANVSWAAALKACHAFWDSAEGAEDLVKAVGLRRDDPIGEVFHQFAMVGGSVRLQDLIDYLGSLGALAELPPAGIAAGLRALISLQVIDEVRVGDAGPTASTELQLEPRFLRAWEAVHGLE